MGTMKIVFGKALFLLAVLTLAVAQGALATNYYVRPNGSNTANGLSWTNAWKHPNYTNGRISQGDSVIIAPGQYDTCYITPPRGGSLPTVYACSSLTMRSATILSSGLPVTGGWTVYSGNVYRSTNTIPVRWNSWYGDGQMTCSQDNILLHQQRSLADVNAEGEAYYNTSTRYLYVYVRGGGTPANYTIRQSQCPVVNFDYGNQDKIIFDGLTLDLGVQGVIVIASANSSDTDAPDSIVVRNCNIQNGGSTSSASNPALVYSGNPGIASTNDLGHYFTAVNDTFRYCWADDAVDEHNGNGIGFYVQANVLCSASVFLDLKGVCINFKNGYSASVNIANNVIMDNKFIGGALGVRIAAHTDSIIVCGNQFINQTYRGLVASSSSGTPQAYNRVKVFNNTFYNVPTAILMSPTAGGTGSKNEVRYNLIFDTTSFTNSIAFVTQGGEAPQQSPALETYWSADSNMYYHGSGSFSCAFTSNSGYSGSSWTSWRNAGFDVRGLNGTNPGFAASDQADLARYASAQEMNRTYAGKTWTRFGAWQPGGGEPCSAPSSVVLVSPADGATNQTQPLTLDWNDLTDATSYQVQVDNNSNFGSPEVSQSTVSSGYVVTGLAGGTTFYWRVRAQNVCSYGPWTSARAFTTACPLPGTPTLATPADAATGLTQPVTLDWADVSGAINYQIQVDDQSAFSSPTVDQTSATSNLAVSSLSASVTYYWRVRAQNACGWGSWSTARSFSTACSTPATPTLVSPANGATGVAKPVTTDWGDVSGATNYQVQIDDNSDFSSPVVDQQSATSSYSTSAPVDGITYYWRVRAQNACGWGSWSGSRTFMTSTPDVTPPTIGSVTATEITENSALITWTTNEVASTQVNYGLTTSYGSTTALNATLVTAHAQILTGLSALTTYHYRVRSTDAAGNEGVSGDFSFTTLSNLADGMAPHVSGTYPGYDSLNVTDGVYDPFGAEATTWAAESATNPHWVEVDLGSTRQIQRAAVYWAWNATQSRWMTSQQFRFQTWNGSTFTDVTTVNTSAADSCTYVDFTPVTTSRIRYYQPANMGPATYPTVAWLSELAVFGVTAPTVPTLVNPIGGASVGTLTPTLTINNSTDPDGHAIVYDFQVSTSSSFSSITAQAASLAQGGGATTAWTVNTTLTNGTTYYWRARAYDGFLYSNYSTTGSFVVGTNTAPSVPVLASPATGSQVGTLTPTLTINNSTDAEGNSITYDFQVSTSTSFSTIAAQATGVAQGAGGQTSWIVSTNLTTGTTYHWRVRAYDGALYSSWAAYRSFTVAVNTAPTVPALSSPAAGATVTTLTPTLVLTNSTDAEGNTITYDFQVSTSSSFATIAAQVTGRSQGTGTTSWVVSPDLVNGTTYYWRARAYDGSLYSAYASSRTFVVSVNTPPGSPGPLSPENNGRVIDMTPDLVVSNANDPNGDALTYQFQLYNESGSTLLSQSTMLAPGASTSQWTVPFTLANKTKYQWRARAYDNQAYSNWTSAQYFRTNRRPLSPTPVSPIDGDTVFGSVHQYIVNNASDPDGDSLTYEFEVYSDSLLTELVERQVSVTPGATTTSAISTTGYINNHFYWWRARSNDSTHTSDWSPTEMFYQREMVLDVTDAPSADAPSDGAIERTVNPQFRISWVGATDSSICVFEIARDIEFVDLVSGGSVRGSGTAAEWVPDEPLTEGRFYWRAKRGESGYSKVNAFTVAAPIYLSPTQFTYDLEGLTLHNLPAGSRFEVFTASATRVYERENLAGEYVWDGRNANGEKLGPGVFLWYVRYDDKNISGKFIVIR